MIDQSPSVKLYERANSLLDQFRASVRAAKKRVRSWGVDDTFTSNGIRCIARPHCEIENQSPAYKEFHHAHEAGLVYDLKLMIAGFNSVIVKVRQPEEHV